MTNADREAFEAWETECGARQAVIWDNRGFPYECGATEIPGRSLYRDWRLWQASRRAALEEAAKVAWEYARAIRKPSRNKTLCDDVAGAIRALLRTTDPVVRADEQGSSLREDAPQEMSVQDYLRKVLKTPMERAYYGVEDEGSAVESHPASEVRATHSPSPSAALPSSPPSCPTCGADSPELEWYRDYEDAGVRRHMELENARDGWCLCPDAFHDERSEP